MIIISEILKSVKSIFNHSMIVASKKSFDPPFFCKENMLYVTRWNVRKHTEILGKGGGKKEHKNAFKKVSVFILCHLTCFVLSLWPTLKRSKNLINQFFDHTSELIESCKSIFNHTMILPSKKSFDPMILPSKKSFDPFFYH